MIATNLRRLLVAVSVSIAIGLLLGGNWTGGRAVVLTRTIPLAVTGTLIFGTLERWPATLPRWISRWVLQVISVGVAMPLTTLAMYVVTTPAGSPRFWTDPARAQGFMSLTFTAVLVAPWMALSTVIRQKEALAREQALAFQLERSELERRALDTRLHLLQAQVAPHFLFNTLANVQALVDARSPNASTLLRQLTTYLRAAVPLLDEPATTIRQEIGLVEAYLELMRMRMPDRLEYVLHVDDAALPLACPPTTLLTLVENAVRHGIDPSERGGRIEIDVRRNGDRCRLRVCDDGVGVHHTTAGGGTGLSSLRERLSAVFRGNASVTVVPLEPHGVSVEVDVPAIDATRA